MKKYTILSSDSEGSKSIKEKKRETNISNRISNQSIHNKRLGTTEDKKVVSNPHNSSQNQKNGCEPESLTWDLVRTPSMKSDEEISYWITTAKAPCLFYYDKDINTSSSVYLEEGTSQLQVIKGAEAETKKSTYIVNGKVYDIPKYIPSGQQHVNGVSKLNNASNTNGAPLSGYDTLMSGVEKRHSLENNRSQEPKTKCQTNKTEPLDEYDTDSSVLTINYIKYVNHKQAHNSKQLKRKRSWEQACGDITSSVDSFNYLKNSKSVSKDSGCISQDKECSALECNSHGHVRWGSERPSKLHRPSYNIDNILKPSYEVTKQLNLTIFNNSKASTPSFGNSSNHESKAFKHLSPGQTTNMLGDYDCADGQRNYSKDFTPTQVLYTKIETVEYISEGFPPPPRAGDRLPSHIPPPNKLSVNFIKEESYNIS